MALTQDATCVNGHRTGTDEGCEHCIAWGSEISDEIKKAHNTVANLVGVMMSHGVDPALVMMSSQLHILQQVVLQGDPYASANYDLAVHTMAAQQMRALAVQSTKKPGLILP